MRRTPFCSRPRRKAYYGKWIVNLFPIYVFLSRFSMYVIRCIQLLLSFCPFIIMLPPILQMNMFPPHNSPYFKIANKAAARYAVTHMLTPSLRISIIILSVKNFFALCSIFFFFFLRNLRNSHNCLGQSMGDVIGETECN